MKNRNLGQKIATALMIAASAGMVAAAIAQPTPDSPAGNSATPLSDSGQQYVEQLVSAQPVLLSCPPAFIVTGLDDIDDDDFSAESESEYSLTAAALPRESADASQGTITPTLTETGGNQADTTPINGRITLTDEAAANGSQLTFAPAQGANQGGDGESMALAGAVAAQKTPAGDGRGLMATTCAVPQVSQWLIGPDTLIGSSASLVLSNPGLTPVTVSLNVWGSAGQLDHENTYTIAPDHSRTVLLEASTMESRLAVEVTSAGGPVAAVIYHHLLDGLTAGGVDSLTASSSPSQTLWVPPFMVPTQEDEQGERRGEVVLVNPNDELASATIWVVGPDGPRVLAGAEDMPIDPDTVITVSLGGINDQWAGLFVESDLPITGSVQLVWDGEPNPLDPATLISDRTWIPALRPADQQVLVLPEMDDVQITAGLVNTTDETQNVAITATAANGSQTELDVRLPARSSHVIDHDMFAPGASILITGHGVIGSALVQTHDELGPMLTVITPLPDQQRSQSIPVAVDTP